MVKIIVIKKNYLGKIGDIVNVKLGYARNYLIPYSFALYVSKKNINFLKKKYILKNKINKEKENKFLEIYNKLILLSPINLYYKCGKNGKLFNSIKSIDISNIISKRLNCVFDKKYIKLFNRPIKYLGKYIIKIFFYNKNINFVINVISKR